MSLRDLDRFLSYIPIFCLLMLVVVLLARFCQHYVLPKLISAQGDQRNLQGHRFASNYPRNPYYTHQNRPIPQEEIPSNTPYPMNSAMPMAQTSHLPQNSRLVNKNLVVCKIFPNEN